jgi:hypothetical protein
MMADASVVCVEEALGSPVVHTITIHVTDNANLSPMELAGAQAYATAAYRAAGFHIVWSSTLWQPEAGQSAGPPSIDVRVVIAPADMAEKKCREENLNGRQQSWRRGFDGLDGGEMESAPEPAADVHQEPGAADPSPVHGPTRVRAIYEGSEGTSVRTRRLHPQASPVIPCRPRRRLISQWPRASRSPLRAEEPAKTLPRSET